MSRIEKTILWVLFPVLLLVFQNCGFELAPTLVVEQLLASDNTDLKFTCTSPRSRGMSEGRARRLTHDEIKNSISVIFGARVADAVGQSFYLYSPDTFEQDVDEFKPEHNRGHADGIVEIAVIVGEKASEMGGHFQHKGPQAVANLRQGRVKSTPILHDYLPNIMLSLSMDEVQNAFMLLTR